MTGLLGSALLAVLLVIALVIAAYAAATLPQRVREWRDRRSVAHWQRLGEAYRGELEALKRVHEEVRHGSP